MKSFYLIFSVHDQDSNLTVTAYTKLHARDVHTDLVSLFCLREVVDKRCQNELGEDKCSENTEEADLI